MNSPRPKYEGWLYWLAFLIALGFRLIQLGAKPLTDSEAQFALQALHIAQGENPLLGPQPAYILFTSVLFLVTESTNFMARFIPAIAGSALVFAPYYFREKLKPLPALILAFLFAFDPGLVAISRQAGGTILAETTCFSPGGCGGTDAPSQPASSPVLRFSPDLRPGPAS
jgi:predicted membrane-bound mannosyltransferase